MQRLVQSNVPGKAPNASSDISLEWWMENLCMRCLAASFLRWVVISCVMWGLPIYQSTPSFAASFPRADLQGAVVPQVPRDHQVRQDHRVLVARQGLRVRAALRDRAEAVVGLDPVTHLDSVEAPDPRGTRARKVALARMDPAVQVVQVAPRVLNHRAAVDPVAADRKVDRAASPDLALSPVPNPVHSRAHKVGASHRVPDHRDRVAAALNQAGLHQAVPVREVNHQVVAMVAARARVDLVPAPDQGVALDRDPLVKAPAVLVLVASVAPGNRLARVALAVAPQEVAAAPVHQVAVAAHATTSGMDLAGLRLLCRIHASLKPARFRRYVSVMEMHQPAPALMWDKPITQDVSKVRYE